MKEKETAMRETIEEMFPVASDDVQAILAELRTVTRETVPEATEIFTHGALGYGPSSSGVDRVFYIQAQNGYANLGFFYGMGLTDPDGLLEGTGTRMRHIKIRSLAEARNPALVPLLSESWRLGSAAVALAHASSKTRRKGPGAGGADMYVDDQTQ
jgi:hypothetical protein